MLGKLTNLFRWKPEPHDNSVVSDPAAVNSDDEQLPSSMQITQKIWGEGPCWCCHPTTFQLIISAPATSQKMIAEIAEEEKNLKKGRFVHFSREPQEHIVHVEDITTASAMLDFIGNSITRPWHLRRNDPGLDFSFASDTEAVMFKLAFG